jgi:type VI secretion system protein ImpA
MDSSIEQLVAPISAENPCGADLEDTQLLASFDGYRLFGQMSQPVDDTDWREIRDKALEGLGQSKDLRLLAHLGAAQLRMGGLVAFCEVLKAAGEWFALYPDAVYPRVDEDAILRRNALNCFADRMAIVEAVRRQPFLVNPQLGAFGLRDFEIAKGKIPSPDGSSGSPSEALLSGALAAMDAATLESTNASLIASIAALRQVDKAMRDGHGTEGAPDFESLQEPLVEIQRILQGEIQTRADNAAPTGGDASEAGPGTAGAGAVITAGSVRSRDDAIRALDAVATYFRKNEPSSPVPVVVERAKQLVAKDFFEILADLAPDGLAQAKLWGSREE